MGDAPAGHDAHGQAGDGTPIEALAEVTARRISHVLRMRGTNADHALRQAVAREARELAEAMLAGTGEAWLPAWPPDDLDALADACSSILCDLPPASVMGVLLPDPHLAPLEHDLQAICEVGRGCDLRDVPPRGESDGTLAQQVWRYANDATARWGMMSPHGKALARVDKVAIRKGLIVGLGFDGYLRAEQEMAGIFAPRVPYSLGTYGREGETDGEGD